MSFLAVSDTGASEKYRWVFPYESNLMTFWLLVQMLYQWATGDSWEPSLVAYMTPTFKKPNPRPTCTTETKKTIAQLFYSTLYKLLLTTVNLGITSYSLVCPFVLSKNTNSFYQGCQLAQKAGYYDHVLQNLLWEIKGTSSKYSFPQKEVCFRYTYANLSVSPARIHASMVSLSSQIFLLFPLMIWKNLIEELLPIKPVP